MFKFQTFSVVAGTEACNAKCDFCIASMTPDNGVDQKYSGINWSNLKTACRLAEKGGVTTALITGKGEPTLYPEDIDGYMQVLPEYFPLIELQTNALLFSEGKRSRNNGEMISRLARWRDAGMTTIIISIVHYDREANKRIYLNTKKKLSGEQYPDLRETTDFLHDLGFSVRWGCIGCKGYIDSWGEIKALASYAKKCGAEQLTWRPVVSPKNQEIPKFLMRPTY